MRTLLTLSGSLLGWAAKSYFATSLEVQLHEFPPHHGLGHISQAKACPITLDTSRCRGHLTEDVQGGADRDALV